MKIGTLIKKGNSEPTILLTFPHETENNRNNTKTEAGLYLGPHSFLRFFPNIGLINDHKPIPVSNLGDVLRPKQHLKHKYHTLKTQFSLEELLQNTTELISQKVFSLQKELIFIGSFEESFFSIYKAFHQDHETSKEKDILLICSPFLYCSTHYEGVNIRSESFMRSVIHEIKQNKRNTKIYFLGFQTRNGNSLEKQFVDENSDLIEIVEMEKLEVGFIVSFFAEINSKESQANKFVFFSFNLIPSIYFPGKSFVNSDSVVDNRTALVLFRNLAKLQNLKSLSFHDYNPQIEDYTSGIFFSTILFEFLKAKFGFN